MDCGGVCIAGLKNLPLSVVVEVVEPIPRIGVHGVDYCLISDRVVNQQVGVDTSRVLEVA